MSQGVLGFKYEEEKHDTGMTGLASLPVYLDLPHATGLSELIGRHLQMKQRGILTRIWTSIVSELQIWDFFWGFFLDTTFLLLYFEHI